VPRPVKMRVSYRDDGGYLLRLEAAVMQDARQSEAWRQETAGLARALALRLLEADGEKKKLVSGR
jgi:hypothetical protein